MPFRLWVDPSRDEYVRQQYGKTPVMRIASVLGVSHVAVLRRARKLGLARLKNWLSYERIRSIPSLVSSGMTNAQIAAHLGCHERTVTWHIKRLGCQRRRSVKKEKQIERRTAVDYSDRIPLYVLMRPCFDPPGSPRRIEVERQREARGVMNHRLDVT